MSWPAQPVLGVCLYMPMVEIHDLAIIQLAGQSTYGCKSCLRCVCGFVGQSVSVSYGRAVGILSPRYLDLFSVGLIVNFVCILLLKEHCQKLTKFFKYFLIVWLLLVVNGFTKIAPAIILDLQEKQYTGREQEKNVRQYLTSGDFSHLDNKPFLHIPYPRADRLKSLLDNKIIQAFLPGNLAQPLSPSHVDVSGLVLDTAGYYPTTPRPARGKSIWDIQ